MNTETVLIHISNTIERGLSNADMEAFRKELAIKVNDLLVNNFAALVQILYRIDIDEISLKQTLLKRKNEQAGSVIADIMINRIANTIETKKHFRDLNNKQVDEDLKW